VLRDTMLTTVKVKCGKMLQSINRNHHAVVHRSD
jgi:hypothetical protein